MKKMIKDYGLMPLMIIFILGTLSVKEFLEYSIGRSETNIIYFSILITGGIFAVLSKRATGIFLLFVGLFFLTLGFSSFPSNQFERAYSHYHEFENSNKMSPNSDKLSPIVADYVKREMEVRELELKIAELRYYGPSEYYGFPTWRYIIFFLAIGLTIAYGIFWIIQEFRDESPDPIYKKVRYTNQVFKNKIYKNQIKIYPTSFTPEVILRQDGVISLKGKSIPNDALSFFENIISWISTYIISPAKTTFVYIDLSDINADSKKYFVQILQKISSVTKKDDGYIINWFYFQDDSYVLEFGEQIATELDIPIVFIKKHYE